MSLPENRELRQFIALYAKYYGVQLSLDEATSKLQALTGLLSVVRESGAARNGTSNSVTYKPSNPKEDA